MKSWTLFEETTSPDGRVVSLWKRDQEWSIRVDGRPLMGNRRFGSEVALAEKAVQQLAQPEQSSVLVGGLGFGYTLRALLDLLPQSAKVMVVELIPAVGVWNRGPLAEFAGSPLDDPRVELRIGDVVSMLKNSEARYDAILLDTDNGPAAMTQSGNAWLYSHRGLVRTRRALRPHGVLTVWSASLDPEFTLRLRAAGYHVACDLVPARDAGKRARHVIWTARRDAKQE